MAIQDNLEDAALLRSKEIDEIIGRPPHWLIQWGISIFFLVFLMVFLLSYFIEYPETVTAPFRIISNNPAIPISVNKNGIIVKLLIKEGSCIHKNDTLFYWRTNINSGQLAFLAPSAGRVDFISPLVNRQTVSEGTPLFYVIPASEYYATLYVNSSNIRKVNSFQQVRLDVSQCPAQEYGYINGDVNYVSNVNTAKGYYIKVLLPKGLKSDKNRVIPFRDDLSGVAVIIVNKHKLIDKFLYRWFKKDNKKTH
jgi:multidrug efflux pump subunit AcrA (membrane-fusion protein)